MKTSPCGVWLFTVVLGGVALSLPAEIIINQAAPDQPQVRVNAVPPPANAGDAEDKDILKAPVSDALKFFNGDVLHGTLVSIDPQKGVVWKNPESKADIEFATKGISKIQFAPKNHPSATTQTNQCLVRLTNGDELGGQLSALDETTLSLDTWYAGRLTIQRKMAQSIRMIKKSADSIYEGPTSIEGWTTGRNRNGWKYVEGGFSTSRPASIGRDVKLPAMAHIEFEATWRGQIQLLFNIYTDSFEEYGSNCYMLQMNAGYVYLQRVRRNGGSSNLGQAEVQNLNSKNKARVELFVNKEQRTITIFIDGVMVKQWKDTGEFVGQGTGILFYHQSMNQVRVANIRITEWDGKLEDRSSAAAAKAKDDQVELENRDKLSGSLKGIKDGKMTFVTTFANMDIPVDRVFLVELANDSTVSQAKDRKNIKAIFSDRGSVTFSLEKWDAKQVLGSSPSFGSAKFSSAAFSQAVLNIDDQNKPDTEIHEPMDEGE